MTQAPAGPIDSDPQPPGAEGMPDVHVAIPPAETGLRRTVTDAAQRPPDRQPEMACEVFRLIEATP